MISHGSKGSKSGTKDDGAPVTAEGMDEEGEDGSEGEGEDGVDES